MTDATRTEAVILAYWKSWQDADWDTLRESLAPELNFGGQPMSRDAFLQMCQAGEPWKDVELLESIFNEQGGALIYEGTDSKSGDRIRVAEIVRVNEGRVSKAVACFGSGMPPS